MPKIDVVPCRMHITAYTAVLVALRDQTLPKLPLELTRWWGVWFRDLAEDSKFSKDAGGHIATGWAFW